MNALRMLRVRELKHKTGRARSTLYDDITNGLMVPPVRNGLRCSVWPEHEVDEILRARIAGRSDDEIRALVTRLHAARCAEVA